MAGAEAEGPQGGGGSFLGVGDEAGSIQDMILGTAMALMEGVAMGEHLPLCACDIALACACHKPVRK